VNQPATRRSSTWVRWALMDEQTTPARPGTPAPDRAAASSTASDELLTDELLVEEISIDGMCGVY
jgi:mycofactocin precursor